MIKKMIEKMDSRLLFALFILANLVVIFGSYGFMWWMVGLAE